MKQIFLSKMNKFIFTAMMLAASAALLLSCKHPNNPSPPKVTISIAGDINVTVKDPKSFTAAKESKWSAIKETAQAMVTYKEGYDVLAWKLGSATGADITDDTVFGSDETIFVVSKKVNERTYTVRHLKQNIDDDKYTQAEEETKLGIIDENTAAEAKDYQGFTKPAVTQQKIKADNSTVVESKYDRKIITLKFKFDGGTTTPVLEGDALKGKFGATVSVTEPTKENYAFNGWEPKLPGTFTLENDNSTYTATWQQPTITVKADERLQVTAPTSMKVNFKTTWVP